jgi:hypothetical protein
MASLDAQEDHQGCPRSWGSARGGAECAGTRLLGSDDDRETAFDVREVSKGSVDSSQPDLVKNADDSVDVYLGPTAPSGKEANWIPTAEGRRFFLLFRFYGPEPGVFDGSFELNDIELTD